LAQNRIGISTCGDAVIEGTPISGFIESFTLSLPEGISVAETATGLLEYVRQINPNLNAWFHVTGYRGKNGVQVTEAWIVGIAENQTRSSIASGEQGAQWNGELDIKRKQCHVSALLSIFRVGHDLPTGSKMLPKPKRGLDQVLDVLAPSDF